MKLTTNLGLKKPDLTDYVNVADLNENSDTLDTEISALKQGSTTITDLQTTDKTLKGAINELNNKKVDKVTGKDLSANDYTDQEKQKNQDNKNNITNLAGTGRTTETVKKNAEDIKTKADNTDVARTTTAKDVTGAINEIDADLTEFKNTTNTHLADKMYQTAGGTGAVITLSIAGTLIDGYPITFIASDNNNGTPTTINGKSLYKPNTTTSPKLISGKAYTIWYSSASDCFFIKASAEGDSSVGDVLAGKVFSNDDDIGLVGTMHNAGAVSITPSTTNKVIAQGYHNGNGYVKGDANLIASNIRLGKSIFGVSGNLKDVRIQDFVVGTTLKSETLALSQSGTVNVGWSTYYHSSTSISVNGVIVASGTGTNGYGSKVVSAGTSTITLTSSRGSEAGFAAYAIN